MAKKILLTISLLVSNRPNTIRKCLDSLQPLLNAIPSELILTDTGCGAQVRSIIEEYTDHIIDFEWCDDFSKARNAGLKQAKGEWFLFLDDDEWFEDTTDIIAFFKSGEYRRYDYGVYIQRNYMTKDGSVYSDLPVGRMIKLSPEVRFIYSIHELFDYVPRKIKQFHSFVHHYGYAYETEGEAIAHATRNIMLLNIEHAQSPRNAKHIVQLIQEYNTIDNIEMSLSLSQEGITLAETGPMEMDFCVNSIYANEVECYLILGRGDEAIEAGEKYLKKGKLDALCNAMISGLIAEAYVKNGEPEKCMERVSFYNEIYEYAGEHGIYSVGYVTTINSDCFEPRRRSVIFGTGVQAAVSLGMASKALKWFYSIDMASKTIFLNHDMIEGIIQRIAKIGAGEIEGSTEEMAALEEMCSVLLERKDMEAYVLKTILDTCSKETMLSAYAGVKSESWVFALARLLKGEEQEQNALFVWRHMEESLPYIRKFHVLDALEQAGSDVGSVISQIPFSIWEKGLGRLMDAEWFRPWYAKLPQSEELKRLSWESLMLYRRLVKASENAENAQDPEIVKSCLWDYQGVTVSLCEHIYRPEILKENMDVLRAEYQAAFKIKGLKEAMEGGRYSEALETIRQLKELMPQAVGALKPILVELQEKAKESATEQKAMTDEMQMLGMQIRLKIRQLTQNGRIQEALAVAKQLAGLMPNDTDLQVLIGKLERQCAFKEETDG